MEQVKELIQKADVLPGSKRNIAIVTLVVVAALRYFGVEVVSEQVMGIVSAVAEVLAVVGVVFAYLRK